MFLTTQKINIKQNVY